MSVEDGNKPAPRPHHTDRLPPELRAAVPVDYLSPNGTHDKVTDALLAADAQLAAKNEEASALQRLIDSGLARGKLQLADRGPFVQHDPVHHPSHYTSHPARCSCGASIECIQVTEHMGFNLGNAMKYLWRADLKDAAIQDLEKAAWYINREIEKRKKEQG